MRNALILLAVAGLAVACNAFGSGDECKSEGEKEKIQKASAEKPSAAEIEKLIKQLGSENPKTREEASNALRKMGPEVLPYLKAALHSADPEQKRRAEVLRTQIHQDRIEKQAERIAKYGIDVVVERMVRKGKDLTDEEWEVFASIVEKIRASTKRRGELASREYLQFPIKFGPDQGSPGPRRRSRVIAENYGNFCEQALIVCTGSVNLLNGKSTLVFANGDFKSERVESTLVVCDGSVTIATIEKNCAVIARGTVELRSGSGASDSMIIDEYRCEIAGLRFFSLRDLGIFFSVGGGNGVQVATLEKGSLLEKAGLEVSDVVTSINGKKATAVEHTRGLLRSAMADGQIEIEFIGAGDKKGKARVQIPW